MYVILIDTHSYMHVYANIFVNVCVQTFKLEIDFFPYLELTHDKMH